MDNYYRISQAEQQMVGEGSWCGSVATGSSQRLYDVPCFSTGQSSVLDLCNVELQCSAVLHSAVHDSLQRPTYCAVVVFATVAHRGTYIRSAPPPLSSL